MDQKSSLGIAPGLDPSLIVGHVTEEDIDGYIRPQREFEKFVVLKLENVGEFVINVYRGCLADTWQ